MFKSIDTEKHILNVLECNPPENFLSSLKTIIKHRFSKNKSNANPIINAAIIYNTD